MTSKMKFNLKQKRKRLKLISSKTARDFYIFLLDKFCHKFYNVYGEKNEYNKNI